MIDITKFSLLMSVYGQDDPAYLQQALESLCQLTLAPADIVVVEDGPLPVAVQQVLAAYQARWPLRRHALANNVGLGAALAHGLTVCHHEWVARFDSDDICHPERFAKQCAYLAAHSEVALLGGYIAEFDHDWRQAHAVRQTPTQAQAIVAHARTRNPFNHMTVMFKKSAVLAAGNYQCEFLFEDYALWVRMLAQGVVAANLSEVLVYARTGRAMAARRGGWRYARAEVALQWRFFRSGFTSWAKLLANLCVRVPTRLVPSALRVWMYRTCLRRT
ncbi:MAG: glycosyltransferase [Aeromonas sp.]